MDGWYTFTLLLLSFVFCYSVTCGSEWFVRKCAAALIHKIPWVNHVARPGGKNFNACNIVKSWWEWYSGVKFLPKAYIFCLTLIYKMIKYKWNQINNQLWWSNAYFCMLQIDRAEGSRPPDISNIAHELVSGHHHGPGAVCSSIHS